MKTRKKLYVEIEYDDIFRSELYTATVAHSINDDFLNLNATVKEIEPGWTDEDMREFCFMYGGNGIDVELAFQNFKKERNK